MEYRILGKTGLKVSQLGFGGSPLGGVFGPADTDECIRTVHAAIDHGINFFDVAPFYGLTAAERMLGVSLRGIPRDRYILATKVGRYGDRDFDFSAGRVIASVDESLERLGVDYIDLMQCHDIEFGSLDQIVEETIPALHRIQETGKVRFIGITGYPLKIYQGVMSRIDVDTVLGYCHYSLNNRSFERLLPYFEQKNVGVINASPLSMGLLTDAGPPAWHPAPQNIKTVCAEAAAYCKAKGKDISTLALQFATANPKIHTTLVGMATQDELKRNLHSLEEPLDTEFLNEVLHILDPIRDQTWSAPGQQIVDDEYPAYA